MSKNIYRVVAINRATSQATEHYLGDNASLATTTYENVKSTTGFSEEYKIELQRLEPVIVMETE